jgi:hypothetical protein
MSLVKVQRSRLLNEFIASKSPLHFGGRDALFFSDGPINCGRHGNICRRSEKEHANKRAELLTGEVKVDSLPQK